MFLFDKELEGISLMKAMLVFVETSIEQGDVASGVINSSFSLIDWFLANGTEFPSHVMDQIKEAQAAWIAHHKD